MKMKEVTRVITRNTLIAFIGLLGLGLITSCSSEEEVVDQSRIEKFVEITSLQRCNDTDELVPVFVWQTYKYDFDGNKTLLQYDSWLFMDERGDMSQLELVEYLLDEYPWRSHYNPNTHNYDAYRYISREHCPLEYDYPDN